MNRHRHRLRRLAVLVLIGVLGAGCSRGPLEVLEDANDQTVVLSVALAEAVTTSYSASVGQVDVQERERALDKVRAASQQLAVLTTDLDAPARTITLQLLEITDRTLLGVYEAQFDQAESVRLGEFMPKARELASLLSEAETQGGGPDRTAMIVGLIVVGLVALLTAVLSRRPDGSEVSVGDLRPGRKPGADGPIERSWSQLPTLSDDEQASSEETDARSTKMRASEVDLHGLLMTALHQVKDYGWDMSIVCPELKVMADPLKLRHAVLSALGNAFLGGAQRVGIVVEDVEGDVLLTIGRDAPPQQADAEDFAERFRAQIALAVGIDDLDWSLINDDDVSLISVSLGRKVGAEEVSEPVA